MKASTKVRVILKVSKYNVPLFLACCQAVYAAMNAHAASYAGAPVSPAAFLALIQALLGAQTGVKSRTIGAAALRDEARDALWVAVESLRIFIQGLCAASPESAVTLAQNAGMKLAAAPKQNKPILGVKQGPQPGIVILSANVGALMKGLGRQGKTLNWAYCTDGKTWIAVPSTPKGTTTIGGLTPLTMYTFRVSLTAGKAGQGEWHEAQGFLVH